MIIDYMEILQRAAYEKKQIEVLKFMALLSKMSSLELIGFAVFLNVPLRDPNLSDSEARPFEEIFSDMIDEFLKSSDSYRLQILEIAEEVSST